MIEEGCELSNLEISLRLDGKKFNRIYSAPDRRELPFTEENGVYKIFLDSMKGYAVIAAE